MAPLSSPADSQPFRLAYASAPCRGDSMRGTLSSGDLLWIAPLPFEALRVGDVVAFDAGGKVVVHRIVGRDASGFRTQGDGNESRDAAALSPGQLIGIVTEREDTNGRVAVAGGWRGRWRGRVMRTTCRCRVHGARYWYLFARMLRTAGLVSLCWNPRMLTVRFASPEGTLTKYIHRGKTVASWLPDEKRWSCRFPYDLVLSPPVR